MVVLATIIAIYAGAVALIAGFGAPFVAQRRAAMPVPVTLHLLGGAVALAIGAWQVNATRRERRPARHRWMGTTYVVAVTVGAIGALFMATMSEGGMVTHLGFGVLAVLWLVTTLAAYRSVRSRDYVAHRRWMLRSYALTLAAVTLRIYLPLSQVAGLPFEPSYQVISWLCWVPNLVVAELLAVRDPTVAPTVVSLSSAG